MLNVDIKTSKALSKKLKEVLPCPVSAQQTAYVQNINIGKKERLISDIIEITNIRLMEGSFGKDVNRKSFPLIRP